MYEIGKHESEGRENVIQIGKRVSLSETKRCVRRGNVYEIGKHESEGRENVIQKGKRVSPEHYIFCYDALCKCGAFHAFTC